MPDRTRSRSPEVVRPIRLVVSWRLAVGVAVAAAGLTGGVGWIGAIAMGAVTCAVLVGAALVTRRSRPARIDPFAVGEPWRRFVQAGQRAAAELHRTVRATPTGPLRERLATIASRLDRALQETWRIARRGDEIDAAVRRLDPPRLRSTLDTLRQQDAAASTPELAESIASIEHQLATTERLKQRSADTQARLRLAQTRLDELTVRAAEVSIGAGDTDVYEHDVEDLVIELEGLRLALEETSRH